MYMSLLQLFQLDENSLEKLHPRFKEGIESSSPCFERRVAKRCDKWNQGAGRYQLFQPLAVSEPERGSSDIKKSLPTNIHMMFWTKKSGI